MSRRTRFFLLITLVLLPFSAEAQDKIINDSTGKTEYLRMMVGGYVGAGFNLHTANFGALPGVPSCCQEYNSATNIVPAIGLLIEFPIMTDLHLQTRVGYTALGGTLNSTEVIGNEPVLGDGTVPGGERRDVTVEHTLETGLPMIVVEPILGYRVLKNGWVSAGLRGGFLMNTGFDQQETLVSPDGYTFLDGSATRNAVSTDIPDANSLQMHASVGLGYELQVGTGMTIVPEVRYYLPLTKISSVDWSVQTFQVGAAFRYGIYTPREPKIYRDTVYVRDTTIVQKAGLNEDKNYLAQTTSVDDVRDEGDERFITTTIAESWILETPKPFNPSLKAAFVAIENEKRRSVDSIRIEELDVIESYPLLPQVFFDSTVYALNTTNQMLLDESQIRDYSKDYLLRDQIWVYRNLLNIVGDRMRKNPTAKLTITGTTDNTGPEKNNRDLAEQRANSVRDYLVNGWGIEPSRLTVKKRLLPAKPANNTTNEGRAENRRVELSSSDIEIMEPIEFRERDLIITPTDFRLTPTVEDLEGISEWEMTIDQGANHLYTESGMGRPTPIRWDAGNEVTGTNERQADHRYRHRAQYARTGA